MVGRVEVRVKAAGDLAAVLQLPRQGGRGCGVGVGSKPPEGLHHVAPSITPFLPDVGAAEGGHNVVTVKRAPERRRFRVRSGWWGGGVCVQNTRLSTAATETPFTLKLHFSV